MNVDRISGWGLWTLLPLGVLWRVAAHLDWGIAGPLGVAWFIALCFFTAIWLLAALRRQRVNRKTSL